jgi:hypothetical protein
LCKSTFEVIGFLTKMVCMWLKIDNEKFWQLETSVDIEWKFIVSKMNPWILRELAWALYLLHWLSKTMLGSLSKLSVNCILTLYVSSVIYD